MMSKTRSAFLSLYAALTPALASAKCGNVDYSWGRASYCCIVYGVTYLDGYGSIVHP